MPTNYLVEHNIGSIIRSALDIYLGNFTNLFLTYSVPVVPVLVLQMEAQQSDNTGLLIVSLLLGLMVSLFAYGAFTIAVSDICLGNAPSFKRSYTKVLGKLVLVLLGTNLLQILAVLSGLVLLVIPGLVIMLWIILTPQVAILEGRNGIAALKRSKQLGDGAHWRNAGLMMLLSIVSFSIGAVIGGAFAAIDLTNHWIFHVLLMAVNQGLVVPIVLIALVLIYYDRRVRKEGYDVKALAEDLAR